MSIHQKISQFLAEPMDTANGHANRAALTLLRRTSASARVEAARNGIRFVC